MAVLASTRGRVAPMTESPGLQPATDGSGVLVLAGTPIGDVRDASARLVAELAAADVIAAEDTRRLRRLAAALGVDAGRAGGLVLRRQRAVPDAGAAERAARRLTRRARHRRRDAERDRPGLPAGGRRAEAGVTRHGRAGPVGRAHGAGAVRAAGATGSASRGSCRAGRGSARARLAALAAEPRTLVFFEAPHRLAESLAAMAEAFGADRRGRGVPRADEDLRGGAARAARRARGVGRRRRRGEVTVVVARCRAPARCVPRCRRRPRPPTARKAADRRGGRRHVGRKATVASGRRDAVVAAPQGERSRGRHSPGAPVGLGGCPSRSKAFYVTTPIYYVNDAPHIGHAYTTVAGDVLTRWHRQRGERRLVPDRHRRARPEDPAHAPRRTASPRRSGPTGWSRRAWKPLLKTDRRGQRRLHPHHRGAAHRAGRRSSCRGCTTRARLRGRLRGPLLRRLRGVQARRASCSTASGEYAGQRSARSTAGRSRCSARRTTSSGCRATPTRCSTYYEAHPDFVQPESARNEVCPFVRQGLQDLSISRSTFDWGIPVPWDDAHVIYVWFDALLNYVDRGRLRRPTDRASEFAATLAGRRPPGRQGHPALPRRDLAGDADGGRAAGAAQGLRPRLAARRRREDEQDQAHRHRAAADHRRTSAPTRSATTSCARSRSAQDGSFSWEDMARPLHRPSSPTASATSPRGVTAMVERYCDGVAAGRRRRARPSSRSRRRCATAVDAADARDRRGSTSRGRSPRSGHRRRAQRLHHRAGAVGARQGRGRRGARLVDRCSTRRPRRCARSPCCSTR